MQNVLAIMGSPRSQGNTASLLKHIAETAPSSCNVEIVALKDFNINGCTGCSHCQKNVNYYECVQKDDINMLLKKIIHADAVLYGTPLYGHNFSGQLKIFLDRHIPLFKFVGRENKAKAVNEMEIVSAIENKPVGLLVSCQGPTEYNTELIQMLFEKFCESSLATCMGKYIFPFCDPNTQNNQYDETLLRQIWSDILQFVQ